MRWLHRWCGLVLALLLIVSGLTGSLIAFEHELDAWLNPELFRKQGNSHTLDADRLITRIEAADPRLRVTLLPLDARPGGSIEVQVDARQTPGVETATLGFDRLFVDPTTGRVLGRRLWGAWRLDRAHALPLLNRLHRSLTLPGRWGNWLLGTVALGWLGLSFMGLYLSLPTLRKRNARTPLRYSAVAVLNTVSGFWQRWQPAWQIKPGAHGTRFAYDVHRAVGLWTLPLAMVLAFTGVYLNLGNELFKPLISLAGPVTPNPLSVLSIQSNIGRPALTANQSIDRARALLPTSASGFDPWYVSHVPNQGVYRVAFKEPGLRERAFRVRYEQVYLDDRTGALRSLFGYTSGSTSDRFLVWQYPMHSGKALGWLGRVLVALGGLLVALLCGAGVYQWWLRANTLR